MMPPKPTAAVTPVTPVTPVNLVTDDTAAKLSALHADNAQATKDLAAHIGAERWERVIKQCEVQCLHVADIESLCGKMRRTRKEWHPDNELAALQAAAIGLLISIGSAPTADDVQRFEATLGDATTRRDGISKGGQNDPAPVPGQSS